MLKSCTKKYADESDETTFRFVFFCDICGEPFRANPIQFSGDNAPSEPREKKCWEERWKQEHTQAFNRANFEAKTILFGCPGCGQMVCKKCSVSEIHHERIPHDLCIECHRRFVMNRKEPDLRAVPVSEAELKTRGHPKKTETITGPPKKKRRWRLWNK